MRTVKITSLTEKGKDAIKGHYEESKKLGMKHKLALKSMGIRQILVSENPYTLVVEITNSRLQRLLNPDTFILEIEKALGENGATSNDYLIEVEG